MPVDFAAYSDLEREIKAHQATLVAVSKKKPVEDILSLYANGHRDFGENYVNELLEKQQQLPADIHWHFIGHLQTNKVKSILPFIHLVQGVDSLRLLHEIEKQAARINRRISCLLQVHIADEESKFGFSFEEARQAFEESASLSHLNVCGLMGMATMSDDATKIRNEFRALHHLFMELKSQGASGDWNVLSMGMTADYKIALEEGSNMVRVGSAIFGER